MNNLDKTYTDLLQDILDNGVEKKDRTGTGTLSVFGRQIRHNMSEGFPLLTTKKMHFKSVVTELLWFLKGDTNIKYLVDNGCHVWDGDAYKNYLNNFPYEAPYTKEQFINLMKLDNKWAKYHGELGPIYGKQWRSWTKYEQNTKVDGVYDEAIIDQIANLINDLKTNPDSRRLMVNAWNVGEIDQMVLPPCHYGFQCYTRELSLEERKNIWLLKNSDKPHLLYHPGMVEKSHPLTTPQDWFDEQNIPTRAISLMWNQRSVDTFLGLPFNIASYGLLLTMVADEVNMVPDELIGNLGDVHLYSNHVEQAKEQIGRELSLEERHQLALPIWKEKYGPLADMMVPTNIDNTPYKIPTRTREPYPLPTVHVRDGIFCSSVNDVILENYQSHPTIKAPLSN